MTKASKLLVAIIVINNNNNNNNSCLFTNPLKSEKQIKEVIRF